MQTPAGFLVMESSGAVWLRSGRAPGAGTLPGERGRLPVVPQPGCSPAWMLLEPEQVCSAEQRAGGEERPILGGMQMTL